MGWFIASAILMVGVALALLLPPLLRQRDGARTQRELLQRAHAAGLLSDSELSAKLAALPAAGPAAGNSVRRWGLGLAFVVPLSVAALYGAIGTPDGVSVPVQAVQNGAILCSRRPVPQPISRTASEIPVRCGVAARSSRGPLRREKARRSRSRHCGDSGKAASSD